MGYVAQKLKRRLASKGRRQAASLVSLRQLIQRIEDELGPDQGRRRFQEYHPNHAVYLAAQNLVSYLAEELSVLPEMREYCEIVAQAEDEYHPSGPPLSPLTISYFTTWAFFDAAFGKDGETMGTCLLEIGSELEISPGYLRLIRLMQQSRMGLYEHCGVVEERVRLRELITEIPYTCLVPAGYLGQAGELWYARVLPSPFVGSDDSVVFTTPYCLLAPGKQDWLDFLDRSMRKVDLSDSRWATIKGDQGRGHPALEILMKHGLDRYYWPEFIFLAYFNYQRDAIFLTGLPDVPGSLPHASDWD